MIVEYLIRKVNIPAMKTLAVIEGYEIYIVKMFYLSL